MINDTTTLPDSPQELKQIILDLQGQRRRYEQENELLREQVRLLYVRIFGKKSEKGQIAATAIQLPLFDMPEPEAEPEKKGVEVHGHTREKAGRKKLPDNLPRVEVVHDISEEEKICACGCMMSRIGEDVSEKLDIIPAVIQVIRHVRPKYSCKSCEGLETEGAVVKIAPVPKQIIAKGIATAGLLAHILVAKFVDALPFYRQEKQFSRLGVAIPRATMSNWSMKVAEVCSPLLTILHEQIRSGPLINIDETTIQVLQEPGRAATTKSYMWIFRGGSSDQPALVYQYHTGRSGNIAALFLKEYTGVVQTDGYAGYDFIDRLPDINHAGCWAHARRKFMEAQKGSGKGNRAGSVDVALSFIRQIYAVESEGRRNGYSPEQMCALRQEKTRSILTEFRQWLEKKIVQVVPKSLLGTAVNYTFNQWSSLITYLDHGEVTPDNNAAENAIRPFVIGRKNWLFAGTQKGAEASACLYSLIETAKANNLEPYKYLRYLFEKLPFASSEDDYRALLPFNLGQTDLALRNTLSGV